MVASVSVARQDASGSTTVYVTKSGTKYHQAGCSSLSKSAIPMRLDEAAKKYGPCSRCLPAVLAQSAAPSISSAPLASMTPTLAPGVSATGAESVTCPNPTVYITGGSITYHIDPSCQHIAGYPVPRWLSELSSVWTPCLFCKSPNRSLATHPPLPARQTVTPVAAQSTAADNPSAIAPTTPRQTEASDPAASPGRCQAITKKGTQCTRTAQPGSSYCWQHQR
jgi:hypothetical protein